MGRDASDHGHWFLLLNGDPGRHAPPHTDPADAETLVPLPAKPLHQRAPLFDRCAPHGPQVAEAVQHLLVLVRRTATPVVWIFQDQRTDPVSEQRNGQGPAAPGKPLVAGRREMEADRSPLRDLRRQNQFKESGAALRGKREIVIRRREGAPVQQGILGFHSLLPANLDDPRRYEMASCPPEFPDTGKVPPAVLEEKQTVGQVRIEAVEKAEHGCLIQAGLSRCQSQS